MEASVDELPRESISIKVEEEQPSKIERSSIADKPCYQSLRLFAEVFLTIFLTFYADIVLDVFSIEQMWTAGNPLLAKMNICGIGFAHLFGFAYILLKVHVGEIKESRTWIIWTAGFLYFPMFHVLLLALISICDGKIHPMLHETKFVESSIEAVISAAVQVYFIIWESLDWEKKKWLMLSVVSSFATLAFSHAGFDLRSRGVGGLRGSMTEFLSIKFALVFSFRFFEISLRITSLALFQRALRETFQLSGILLAACDFVVISCLMSWYGFRGAELWWSSLPSTFVYMNPLLEKGYAVSIPCNVYFGLRSCELFAMVLLVFLLRPNLRDRSGDIFAGDKHILVASAISFVGMLSLWPLVRYVARDTIKDYPPNLWAERPFSKPEVRLRNQLIVGHSQEQESSTDNYVPLRSEDVTASASFALEPFREQLEKLSTGKQAEGFQESTEQVISLLTLAGNCALPFAETSLKAKFLGKMAEWVDPKSGALTLHREVLDHNGLHVALELVQSSVQAESNVHRDQSFEIECHVLRLIDLLKNQINQREDKIHDIASKSTELAFRVLETSCNERYGHDCDAVQLAVKWLKNCAENTPDDKELLKRMAAVFQNLWKNKFVFASLLVVTPEEISDANLRVAADHFKDEPMTDFSWGDASKKNVQSVLGLCLYEMMQRQRSGKQMVPAHLKLHPVTSDMLTELQDPSEEFKSFHERLERGEVAVLEKVNDLLGDRKTSLDDLINIPAPRLRSIELDIDAAKDAFSKTIEAYIDSKLFQKVQTLVVATRDATVLESLLEACDKLLLSVKYFGHEHQLFKKVVDDVALEAFLPALMKFLDASEAIVTYYALVILTNLVMHAPLHVHLVKFAPRLIQFTRNTSEESGRQAVKIIAILTAPEATCQKLQMYDETVRGMQKLTNKAHKIDNKATRYLAIYAGCLLSQDYSNCPGLQVVENLNLLLSKLEDDISGLGVWFPMQPVLTLARWSRFDANCRQAMMRAEASMAVQKCFVNLMNTRMRDGMVDQDVALRHVLQVLIALHNAGCCDEKIYMRFRPALAEARKIEGLSSLASQLWWGWFQSIDIKWDTDLTKF